MSVVQCLCGACEVHAPAEPRWVVYCHCSQCRRALSADFVTVAGWNPDEVNVVRGADNLSVYNTGKEYRHSCKTCGSKVLVELKQLNQRAVYLTMITTPNHGPNGIVSDAWMPKMHIFYSSGIVDVPDGLPKYNTLPIAFGGDDKTVGEAYHAERRKAAAAAVSA